MPRLLPTLAVVLVAGLAPAQDNGGKRAVTPEDYFSVALVAEVAVSPDGKSVAYPEARWQKSTDDRKADLWVVPTDGKGRPTRLTSDRANERRPRWAADGKSIYVLANRKRAAETKPPYDGSTQVWRVPLDGGEPQAVTRAEGGVSGFDYAPKANELFYAVDATATDEDDFTKLRKAYKAEYRNGTRTVSEVYRLDLDTWRAEMVVDEKKYVRELAVTADGHRLAMIVAADDTVVQSEGHSRVVVWESKSGKVSPTDETWRETAGSPYPWLESLAWSPSGGRLAYCSIFDAYPAEVIVNEFQVGKWAATRMKRREGVHVHGYGSPLKWRDDRTLGYLGERHGQVAVYGYSTETNDVLGVARKDGVVYAFDLGPTPAAVAVTVEGTPGEFADLYLRGKEIKKLTNLNPQAAGWKLPTVKHVTWKAPDGAEVGGVLELPPDHKEGKKLPLVVAIHGGPTTSTKSALEFDPHNGRLYFAAKGYAVLLPNYRGSTGYGDKFLTQLIGHENDIEVKDILAGIQHLIDQGVADPERVAVMGWSNGGYLTDCLIALKDPLVKFRAASSGAGIVDTVAEWGFNDEPAYPIVFKKGLPWETPEVYHKSSPIYGLGNVTTPTLIHVGGADERCPPGHSQSLYRALKEYVKVPTELVVYPGQPHGLGTYTFRKAKMEWDLAWFDKYVLGTK
ncbi:MAG TPA: S9 family peptidase [Fimbriiglobus sp.]|nr:S9 family peptidase [Fimbriiglobus sp.]